MKPKRLDQSNFLHQSTPAFVLPRQLLIEQLNGWQQRKLTLVSAPAGYGKSTLVKLWLHTLDRPVVWVSLDAIDNDFYSFLAHITSAMQHAMNGSCQQIQALLDGSLTPSVDYLIDCLLDDVDSITMPFVIVLDDYHRITAVDIQTLVADLLKYQPKHLHLVIITRYDPAFELHKLRLNGQLLEIRVKDLCLSRDETAHLLQKDLEKKLPNDVIDQIYALTEGWVTGVRFASFMLRDHPDGKRLLDTLSERNQLLADYLMQEVISRQPQSIQNVLMYTSILPRFCAQLCDALLAAVQRNGNGATRPEPTPTCEELLTTLKKNNLFVIEIDESGIWYRYHHLFQKTLYNQLQASLELSQIEALHTAAGMWLEEHGYIDDALVQYKQANNLDAQIALITRVRYRLLNATAWEQIRHYLSYLTPEVIAQHPDLIITQLWLMYHNSQYQKLKQALEQMEALLTDAQLTPEALSSFRGEMNTLYALLAFLDNQPEQAIEHAQFALENVPKPLWIVRALTRMVLAGALQMQGQYNNAIDTMFRGLVEENEASDHFKATEMLGFCNIRWIQADIRGVAKTAEQAIRLSENNPIRGINLFSHYHLGSALYEQNNLQGAEEHFELVTKHPYLSYGDAYLHSAIGLALTLNAQGQPKAANQILHELVEFLFQTRNVTALQIANAFYAELALRQNELWTASSLAEQYIEKMPLINAYRCYFPVLTRAKVWLAQDTTGSRSQASELLNNIEFYLRGIHNKRFLIDTLALQAILSHAEGMQDEAQSKLLEALRLALPGGVIRAFVDLGAPLVPLLRMVETGDPELQEFVPVLLKAFEAEHNAHASSLQLTDGLELSPEDLTIREMDVLRQLDQWKTNVEIAAALHISENTVRYHLKNIFEKLDVHSRRQAVIKAHKLYLIP